MAGGGTDPDGPKLINDLSSLAQAVWFSLLGALAFLSIVLLSTTDADFLLNSKETELPLVRIAVPTERFFFLAPIVLTVLYLYLHFFLLKLWAKFRDTDAAKLASDINPTLINDLALNLKRLGKPRGGDSFAWVSSLATILLIWVLQPALLLAIIWKSGAASGDWQPLTSVRGMALSCLAVSVVAGLLSFTAALGIRYRLLSDKRSVTAIFLLLVLAGGLAIYSGKTLLAGSLPQIDIDRANLVNVGTDWPLAAERREAFRIEWCSHRDTQLDVCGRLAPHRVEDRARVENLQRAYCLKENVRSPSGCRQSFDRLDGAFNVDWRIKRVSELGRLAELDLSGRNLAHASAEGVRLINARLENIDLEAAKLRDGQFEGAKLLHADLTTAEAFYASFDRANMSHAVLTSANLTSSSFEGASMSEADLTAANLTEAQLADADLSHALLIGTNLSRASLRRADLRRADLTGAILDGADLTEAVGLTQDQLADAVGDADTRLPWDGFGNERLRSRTAGPSCRPN